MDNPQTASLFREKAKILDADAVRRTLVRMAHEIIERHKGVEGLAFIGICTRGAVLAKRIAAEI